MAKQVNFYADAVDKASLHDFMQELFPGLLCIQADHGTEAELRPRPVALESVNSTVYLLPAWGRDRIRLVSGRRNGAECLLMQARYNPVIEYIPCMQDRERKLIRIGRLYWAFEGPVAVSESSEVDRLLRWVRSHTVSHPSMPRVRFFQHAAQCASTLQSWLGAPVANPLYTGQRRPA